MHNTSIASYPFYFRTVGGEIGLGHVFRSIAVASCLRDLHNIHPLFVTNNDARVSKILMEWGFSSLAINGSCVTSEFVDGLINQQAHSSPPVCYIDMKTDVSEEIKVWRKFNVKIVLMDNLTPAHTLTDLTILPFPYIYPTKMGLGEADYRIRSGRDWIPVSKRFTAQRNQLPALAERKTILVTMGGADPYRLTLKIMNSLASTEDLHVRIVLGFATQFNEEVFRLNDSFGKRFEVVENTSQIELLMRESGLAITAVGTTIYELATLGVPTVIISNYREDRNDEKELSKLGWTEVLGYHQDVSEEKLRETIMCLWQDSHKRYRMSEAALSFIDGQGAERISRALVDLVTYP